MGTVYVAEDTVLGRRVAVKSLKVPSAQAHKSFRTRFLREARAASRLNHPHIATIHDYGETDDGQPYLVMELIEGHSLNEILSQNTLSPDRVLKIIKQVAEAIAEARGKAQAESLRKTREETPAKKILSVGEIFTA